MIKGLGCDIIEISRIKQAYNRHGQAFLDRLLTANEQAYCFKRKEWAPYIAVRFAAKEAVSKALGCGIGQALNWLDIEISHDSLGKPLVRLSQAKNQDFLHPTILLTLSHCKEYAMAVAVIA